MNHNASIVVPHGALGASDNDDLLEVILRKIAVAASKDARGEWAEKYGTSFENNVFMIHPYCSCEGDDCPWCGSCTCPPQCWTYFIDGEEVSSEQYHSFRYDSIGPLPSRLYKHGTPEYETYEKEWNAGIKERNRRARVEHHPTCDLCLNKGIFALGEEGRGAPNFWHKPSGLKVWWYKYIGRDMEHVGEANLLDVLAQCLASLGESGDA